MKCLKKFLFLPLFYAFSCIALPFIATLFIPSDASLVEPKLKNEITVFNPSDNTTLSMDMEEYITGVVAAEMPASFESEALKAQAVAARTYAMYKSSDNSHEADVCTDFAHCQAYLTEEEMHSNWGGGFDEYYNKIKDAVYSTKGEYLSYNDEPIMAVFHSMGGGMTENSGDVWGTQMPYLVSVDSPGEEEAANYNSCVTMTFDEFKEKLITEYPNAKINSYLDVSEPVLTEGGHVKSMIIGSVTVSGSAIRKIFGLRSTKFDISFSDSNVTFSVMGYGHGVGMSQYGANAMAKDGKTYKDILSHYYQGVSFKNA